MILIAGGGVGGLTLALLLHRHGIPCQVHEAAAEIRPVGVGINALPHAIRELAGLGLLPALDAAAIRTARLVYTNHLGQEIWSEARGLAAGQDVPQFSIHRGRLQVLLWHAALQRLGPEALRCDSRLIGYSQNAEGVVARYQSRDGAVAEVAGSALIGADGIHSTLRAQLHPDDPGIRWNGIQMWRGALDWPAFLGGATQVIGGDAIAKLVIYPIAPGLSPETRLTNWVIYARTGEPGSTPSARESWSRLGDPAAFRHLAQRLHMGFVDVMALTAATPEILEYPMCDRDPLPWWTDRRVTLLGDAAHPMYPVGSNGASQAILDAACLCRLLEGLPVPQALAAYAAERLPATAAVVQSNRQGGPERVIDLVASRAPQGFFDIAQVAEPAELQAIARGYAQITGADRPR